MKKNVVVIAGGNSSEYEVSLKSAVYVYSQIDGSKYNKFLLVMRGRDWHIDVDGSIFPIDKNDFTANIDGTRTSFDFAYITIHGLPGENGQMQGYLDMMGIPYSTGSVLSEAMTFDKYTCTNYAKAFGINTTNPILLSRGVAFSKEAVLESVGLPCFVKPCGEGSSFGVSKVKSAEEFDAAIDLAFSKCRDIVVESFIDGIEFTCGLYKVNGRKVLLPVAEVVPKKDFFDYEAKYDASMSEEIIPGRFSEEVTEKIQEMASNVYDVLRCKGIVRMDGFVRGDEVIMLEVNTTPGMTANSFIPKMVKVADIPLSSILSAIIDEGLNEK